MQKITIDSRKFADKGKKKKKKIDMSQKSTMQKPWPDPNAQMGTSVVFTRSNNPRQADDKEKEMR